MNYIRHLHAFYHHIKRDDRLSTAHISLYMAIFQFWNYHRFQNPFRVNREELMQLSKIGSKNTYHKCTKELHNYRYIIYHTAITKYQPVKVSMIRLDLKVEEKDFLQLDLFNTNDILPAEKANENKQKNSAEKSPQKDGYTSIENGTHTCTEFDTQQCPKNATAHVPFLTASCPKNDTVPVPVLGHYIKHKQINSKHVCVNNTPTQIFLRNKNLGNAVAKLAELNTGGTNEKNTITRAPNSVHATNQIALPEIEIYFQENNFPIQEAQKFFYYNQGRGWMLSENIPVQDWKALAQKWMLNYQNPKTDQHVKTNSQQEHFYPGPGKDYSEPL